MQLPNNKPAAEATSTDDDSSFDYNDEATDNEAETADATPAGDNSTDFEAQAAATRPLMNTVVSRAVSRSLFMSHTLPRVTRICAKMNR